MAFDVLRQPAEEKQRDPSATVFVALYLLLLAFFILLNTLSKSTDSKTKELLESLDSTFVSSGKPSSMPTVFSTLIGDVPAPVQRHREIATLIATGIPLAQIKIVKPGKLMEASFPTRSLFVGRSARIQPGNKALIERLATSLYGAPAGLRYDMEIEIGSAWIKPKDLVEHQALSIAQAGAVARELARAGVPQGTVAAGIKFSDPERVRLVFHVRPEDEPAAIFRAAGPEKARE